MIQMRLHVLPKVIARASLVHYKDIGTKCAIRSTPDVPTGNDDTKVAVQSKKNVTLIVRVCTRTHTDELFPCTPRLRRPSQIVD